MNPYSYDIQTLERKARAVRRHIVRLNANSPAGGHTGADLSQVELLTALYFRILNVAPDRLHDDDRDIYSQKAMLLDVTTACWRKQDSSHWNGFPLISSQIHTYPVIRFGKKRQVLN